MSAFNQMAYDALVAIHNRRETVFVSGTGLDVTIQTYIENVGNNEVMLENRVPPEFAQKFCQSQKYFLQCRLVRLQTSRVIPAGTSMIFPMEENSLMDETRSEERYMFAPHDRVMCELINPFDRETLLCKSVIDMSSGGLSLRTNQQSKIFQPGVHFSSLKITIEGKPFAENSGRVVYARKYIDLSGRLSVQVGFKLDHSQPKEFARP